MALIKCPECGKEVSDKAESCPSCGFGIKKHYDTMYIMKEKEKVEKSKKEKLDKFEESIKMPEKPQMPMAINEGMNTFKFILTLFLCALGVFLLISAYNLMSLSYGHPLRLLLHSLGLLYIDGMPVMIFLMGVTIIVVGLVLGVRAYNENENYNSSMSKYKKEVQEYELAKSSFEDFKNKKIKEKRIEINHKYNEIKQQIKIEPEKKVEVTCPRCGSTQIQMVNRKWSLMAGVLTNKVDRVCINCKKKF